MRASISCRREDTGGYAGGLFDRLTEVFGKDSAFMDIDSLAPGQDFADGIDAALRGCEVAVGADPPSWLTILGQRERRPDAPTTSSSRRSQPRWDAASGLGRDDPSTA